MKLDRNLPDNAGHGKYALLLLRKLEDMRRGTFGELPEDIVKALDLLSREGVIDHGEANTESEFFVIRLKDRFAQPALVAYAEAARAVDREWSDEVWELARRAGPANRWCKDPD